MTDPDLQEAREALEYWERREQKLPRRARGKRREARAHVERWQRRVVEIERDVYGRGIAGTLVQFRAEGRLPAPWRESGRRLAKHGRRAAITAVAVITALTVAFMAACVAIVVAVF